MRFRRLKCLAYKIKRRSPTGIILNILLALADGMCLFGNK